MKTVEEKPRSRIWGRKKKKTLSKANKTNNFIKNLLGLKYRQ
jgi:hypothetical protein